MSFKPDDISQIRKYLNGELDARAMHRLEKRAQEDPFLMDALEGYNNRKDQQNNLDEVQRKLQKRVRRTIKKPAAMWPLIGVAIAVLALILLGAWWVLFNNKPAEKRKANTSRLMEERPRLLNFYNTAYRASLNIHLRRHLVLISVQVCRNGADTLKRKTNRDSNLVATSNIPILATNGFRHITGRVTTVIGDIPIPQAILWNKTTDRQYATDNNGYFNLDARTGDLLYVGYTGFKNEKIIIGKKDKLSVELERKDASMYDATVKGLNFNPYDDWAHPAIGWDTFRSLQSKCKSPDGKTGTVKVKFTVNNDDTLTNFIVLQSLSVATDTAAIKFIRNGNKWLHNTNNKPEILTLKIKFKK